MILDVSNVHKSFTSRSGEIVEVLHDVSFSIEPGSTCSLVGPSGSGKTTLLGLCAGLDRPTSGKIYFQGKELSDFNENQRALLRRDKMGFVFQNFQLVPTLTALENVMLPLELAAKTYSHASKRASALLERVGLSLRLNHLPNQLSGGEQQRVALARALVHAPEIIFADEPTGNLDAENAQNITELLFSLNKESQTALVLVTHNFELAARTQKCLSLKGGCIVS
jgi:putative ABC transport system ATP-binding protein